MNNKNIIPIFFASDKNYLPYLTVSVFSLASFATSSHNYEINILTDDLTESDISELKTLEKENFKINIVDVTHKIESIRQKVALRDYYSVSIYYRLFIPTLFPEHKKAIYLDSDIVLNRDIADMFETDIKDNYLGAVLDEVIWSNPDFTFYARNALGVTEKEYFNSGVLIMNLDKFREDDIENDFYNYVNSYNFGTVAPDQDYLNCKCHGKVTYLDKGWNKMPMGKKLADNELFLIHYNMFMKPWKYKHTMFSDYFWKFAAQTSFYDTLKNKRETYPDNFKINDKKAYNNLVNMALDIAISDNNYKKVVLGEKKTEEYGDYLVEETVNPVFTECPIC